MHVMFSVPGFGSRFVAFLLRPRPQYWLARLYLSSSVLVTTSFAWFSANSTQRAIMASVGPEAWGLMALVTATAALGLFDCLLNDILPDAYHLRWADRRRHQIFMLLSLELWALVWLNTVHGSSTLLGVRYMVDGSACVLVAVFDTVARYRQVQRVRAGQ